MKRLEPVVLNGVEESTDAMTLMSPGHEGHSHRVQFVQDMLVLHCEHDCWDMLDMVCYCCGRDMRFQ